MAKGKKKKANKVRQDLERERRGIRVVQRKSKGGVTRTTEVDRFDLNDIPSNNSGKQETMVDVMRKMKQKMMNNKNGKGNEMANSHTRGHSMPTGSYQTTRVHTQQHVTNQMSNGISAPMANNNQRMQQQQNGNLRQQQFQQQQHMQQQRQQQQLHQQQLLLRQRQQQHRQQQQQRQLLKHNSNINQNDLKKSRYQKMNGGNTHNKGNRNIVGNAVHTNGRASTSLSYRHNGSSMTTKHNNSMKKDDTNSGVRNDIYSNISVLKTSEKSVEDICARILRKRPHWWF